jgi:hypothetical protein
LEEALKLRKANLGPDHPQTLQSMYALAWAYQDADRLNEAIRLSEEALELQKAKQGPDHLATLITLVVQRKELSSIPQPLFPGLGVARGGDPVPPLAPFGQLDRLALGPLGRRGGEDDLQQPPDIRQRQAVRGFSPPAAAPAGPGTTAPT